MSTATPARASQPAVPQPILDRFERAKNTALEHLSRLYGTVRSLRPGGLLADYPDSPRAEAAAVMAAQRMEQIKAECRELAVRHQASPVWPADPLRRVELADELKEQIHVDPDGELLTPEVSVDVDGAFDLAPWLPVDSACSEYDGQFGCTLVAFTARPDGKLGGTAVYTAEILD